MTTNLRTLFAVGIGLVLTACGDGKTTAATTPATITAETTTKLAAADALDGTVDKTVHRCAGCRLGMDGKAEFSLGVADYTLHLCKQGCLDRLRADPAGEIAKLVVPAK